MLLKTVFLFSSALLFSCGTPKSETTSVETNTASEIEAKKALAAQMMADGYLPGRIIYSDLAGDCPYTIQLKKGEKDFFYVDPVNLDENFKKNNTTVWVKYNGLRRMNRCEKAVPVQIAEIRNRDE